MLLEQAQFEPFHAAGGLLLCIQAQKGMVGPVVLTGVEMLCRASCCHCLALPWI